MRSLTDLMYEQVLDNVAMFDCEPGALPHFAIVGDGTTQVTDQAGATPTLTWSPRTLLTAALQMNGTHNVTENWKLQPVMSSGRLRRLRAAFTYVTSAPVYGVEYESDTTAVIRETYAGSFLKGMLEIGVITDAAAFLEEQGYTSKVTSDAAGIHFTNAAPGQADHDAKLYLEKLISDLDTNFPTGWYCAGSHCAAAKSAAYNGHFSKHYTWVECNGVEALSRFTTTVLAIASLDPPATPLVTVTQKYEQGGVNYELKWDEKRSKVNPTIPKSASLVRRNTVQATEVVKAIQKDPEHFGLNKIQAQALIPMGKLDTALSVADLESFRNALSAKAVMLDDEVQKQRLEYASRKLTELIESTDVPDILIQPEPYSVPSAFDRAGSSPFSRGGSGAEFVPNLSPTP